MKYSFLLMVALLSLYACATDLPDYAPLAEGNEWVMDAKITRPDGRIEITTMKRFVEGKEIHNGVSYYRVHGTIKSAPEFNHYELRRKDGKALYSLDSKVPEAKEQIEEKIPFEGGQEWEQVRGHKTAKFTADGIETVVIDL